MSIRINEATDRPGTFYVFQDIAGLFWPDDYSRGNCSAEDLICERLVAKGCKRTGIHYDTPKGMVSFDSESGCFECHADMRGPVEYVVQLIEEILAERQVHREALR